MKKRYQKVHINKIKSEPFNLPVSVDLNSNNSNLNSGPNCALLQLKSTCPLFGQKIDVSAFPTKNQRVGFSNENRRDGFSSGKSTCWLFPLGRRTVCIWIGWVVFSSRFVNNFGMWYRYYVWEFSSRSYNYFLIFKIFLFQKVISFAAW